MSDTTSDVTSNESSLCQAYVTTAFCPVSPLTLPPLGSEQLEVLLRAAGAVLPPLGKNPAAGLDAEVQEVE